MNIFDCIAAEKSFFSPIHDIIKFTIQLVWATLFTYLRTSKAKVSSLFGLDDSEKYEFGENFYLDKTCHSIHS